MESMRKIFVMIACTILSLVSFSQETTSEIRGVVTDQGKPIAGATVSALHIPTGTRYTTTSRNDGRYNLPNVRVGGPYEVTVSFVGYKSENQSNITLILGQEFNADFKLTSQSQQLQEVVVA